MSLDVGIVDIDESGTQGWAEYLCYGIDPYEKVPRRGKKGGTMLVDENGYRMRSACIMFDKLSKSRVLFISSVSFAKSTEWILPGGGIDSRELASDAAVREALEESGVKGVINSFVGRIVDHQKRTHTLVYSAIACSHSERQGIWQFTDDEGNNRKVQFCSWDSIKSLLKVGEKETRLKNITQYRLLRQVQSRFFP